MLSFLDLRLRLLNNWQRDTVEGPWYDSGLAATALESHGFTSVYKAGVWKALGTEGPDKCSKWHRQSLGVIPDKKARLKGGIKKEGEENSRIG